MGVGPSGETIKGSALHVDFSLSSHASDNSFAGEEAGEDTTGETDVDGDGRFVGDEVSGIDDMFPGDFFFEDRAVGTEPYAALAGDFDTKETFSSDPATEAGPAEGESNGWVASDKCAGLQEHGIALEFRANDIAWKGLCQDEFPGRVGGEFVDED